MSESSTEAQARLNLLVGADGLNRLRRANIMLCGVGGVGSWAAEALVRGGIRRLTIVDFDVVKRSNLNRQLLALYSTLGEPKVAVMRQRLLDIAPEAEIDARNQRISPENCLALFQNQSWDFVIDAIDERPAKLALLKTCAENQIPVISSMGSANKLLSGEISVGDLFETSGCPLAALMRKNLRRMGICQGIQVVYSKELPVILSTGSYTGKVAEDAGEKRPLGTISYMPALFGLRCAAFVLESLLNAKHYCRKGECDSGIHKEK